uniref:Uncharacterized protein n=1 Tax=Myotis myotis TaxID=51298 RepID=A0A7J7YEE0_MYOMY|nr:hypothetical protein mMyoMyo1_011180 [Myotis myotis]
MQINRQQRWQLICICRHQVTKRSLLAPGRSSEQSLVWRAKSKEGSPPHQPRPRGPRGQGRAKPLARCAGLAPRAGVASEKRRAKPTMPASPGEEQRPGFQVLEENWYQQPGEGAPEGPQTERGHRLG